MQNRSKQTRLLVHAGSSTREGRVSITTVKRKNSKKKANIIKVVAKISSRLMFCVQKRLV